MPDRILDLRLFRYALTSAEHGSFRRAAAALNVQQSTVSRGVRNLEHRVGAELFERGHAGIRPTPAGDRFLEEAIRGFDHLERAMQRVIAVQRGEHGDLTVGLSVPIVLLGRASMHSLLHRHLHGRSDKDFLHTIDVYGEKCQNVCLVSL